MENLLKWFSDNKDIVQPLSSLLAVLIGFLSISLTVITLRTNRKHNRLSVKPIADISANDFEDRLSVILSNKGSGPLIIKSIRVIKNGGSKNNLIDWMPQIPANMFWGNFHKNIEGSALRPSDFIPLIEFSLDLNSAKQLEVRDTIRFALSDITIELEYEDIYNNSFKYPEHSLSWFGRHFDGNDVSKLNMPAS